MGMTREEAVNKYIIPAIHRTWNDKVCKEIAKILKQEPCEDAISREDAILQIQRYGVGCFDAEEFSPEECERFVINKLNDLPSVYLYYLQKQRKGSWIKITDDYSYFYVCSACWSKVPKDDFGNDYFSPFCPECGAEMIESEVDE